MSEDPRGRVVRRAQATLNVVITVFWIVPMLIFWYRAWDARAPLVSMAYLISSAAGLMAAFLPDSYFRPRAFELSGSLYETAGVQRFGRYMMHGDYMNRRIRKIIPGYRVIGGRDSMHRIEAHTRESERGHIVWLLSGVPPAIYAIVSGWSKFAAYFVVVNIILNIYPILLQRYTRARIYRILRDA